MALQKLVPSHEKTVQIYLQIFKLIFNILIRFSLSLFYGKRYTQIQAEKGICSYKEAVTDVEKSNTEEMYSSYGFNAGHALLLPGTKVEVTYGHKKLLLTINTIPPTSSNTTLELTKEAALVLGIRPGHVECYVKISTIDQSYNYLPPAIFLIFYLTSMLLIMG